MKTYNPIELSKELPPKSDYYFVIYDKGEENQLEYSKKLKKFIHLFQPKYWLKEVESPKAVTDGEIEEAFPLEVSRVMFKPSMEYNKAQEHRREGAEWMREQQGEGAKERYEKAMEFFIEPLSQGHRFRSTNHDSRLAKALRIASGLTDKQ